MRLTLSWNTGHLTVRE